MRPYVVHLVSTTECAMRDAQAVAIAEAICAGSQAGCHSPAPPTAAAGITISIECWRDENGKLHCKLSVSFGSAAA